MDKPKKLYLASCIFIAGASVMLIELVGTRFISPIFGSSLYVWTGLISVALGSLAVGYWVGGIIADKRPVFSTLYILFLFIGGAMIPVPFLSDYIMAECYMLFGSIGGGFCSTIALFSLPLLMLGMVPPIIIRLRATMIETIGVTAGKLYAVSTIGSLAGTIGTGFFLIPTIGNNEIFLGCAAVLLFFSGVGWVFIEKKSMAVALIIIAAAIPFSSKLAAGSKDGLLFASQSLYGRIEVVDKYGERLLLIDGNINSHISLNPGIHPIQCEYVRKFSLLPLFRPEGRIGLCIGLGGGLIPTLLAESGIFFDVVEIDPVIPEIARSFFGGLKNNETVFIEDGRNYIRKCDRQYDFIVSDASNIDHVPVHLYSKEFFMEAASRLTPDGIFAMNTIGTTQGMEFECIQATLGSVFDHVRAFRAHMTPTFGNAVFFASKSPLVLSQINEAIYKADEAQFKGTGMVLTDNFNPIDVLSAKVGAVVRRNYY